MAVAHVVAHQCKVNQHWKVVRLISPKTADDLIGHTGGSSAIDGNVLIISMHASVPFQIMLVNGILAVSQRPRSAHPSERRQIVSETVNKPLIKSSFK